MRQRISGPTEVADPGREVMRQERVPRPELLAPKRETATDDDKEVTAYIVRSLRQIEDDGP